MAGIEDEINLDDFGADNIDPAPKQKRTRKGLEPDGIEDPRFTKKGYKRHTVLIHPDILKRAKEYAYYKRIKFKDLLEEALSEYLSRKIDAKTDQRMNQINALREGEESNL
ncbi:MAG: hypothetical protein AAF798_19425 [Bacteroidota bacterium]